jgi:hypothetical protein
MRCPAAGPPRCLLKTSWTDGNPIGVWSRDAGRLWATESKDTKFGQFNETDLKVFHESMKLLIQIGAQLLALPPHYMSFVGDNPTSADAASVLRRRSWSSVWSGSRPTLAAPGRKCSVSCSGSRRASGTLQSDES